MSDRSSPLLFAVAFRLLAENPTDDHKAIARKMFDHYWTNGFDFCCEQMGCDADLVTLGLAEVLPTEEGPQVFYITDDGKRVI